MKIGIDVDGVILDFERVSKTYGDLYDFTVLGKKGVINRSEHYLNNIYDWTEEENKTFMDKYFVELSKKTNIIPGAKEVINMLKTDGNELIIISARGQKIEEMKNVAMTKLQQEGLEFDKYYWKQNDKLKVAKEEKIEYMIDDSYNVCKRLSENKIKTIYFRDKGMKKLKQNEYIQEVSNWGEIYRIIKKDER